jgi:glycosyltransferase involved in cell wall biosynthesis
MLPFELKEAFRFNSLFTKLKFITIRISQIITFKNSNGTIFLSNYAKTKISDIVRFKNYEIIPHGIDFNWFTPPKEQLLFSNYNQNNKFNLTYVSAITAYKHQWNVALAVISLFDEGFPISLNLIGPHDKQGLAKLNDVLNKFPSSKFCINYLGNIEHNNLPIYYKKADAFIYASSCENMPIILMAIEKQVD